MDLELCDSRGKFRDNVVYKESSIFEAARISGFDDAYRRAGIAFTGNMEKNFVVLTDNRKAPAPAPQSKPRRHLKKQPLDDQQKVYNQSKGVRVKRGGRGGGRGG